LESFVFFGAAGAPLRDQSVKITSYTSPSIWREVREQKQFEHLCFRLKTGIRSRRISTIRDSLGQKSRLVFFKQRYGLRYDIREVLARRKSLVDGFEGERGNPDYLPLQREYRGMLQELKKLEGKY
jgi:hypothetical protein